MGHHSSKHKKGEVQEEPVPPPPPPRPQLIGGESVLLKEEHLIAISAHLLEENKKRWNLLFRSDKHGKSFSQMGTRMCLRGPTIVVIEDTKGNVFGGFADESWRSPSERAKEAQSEYAAQARAEKCGQEYEIHESHKQAKMFFGGERCLVFSLEPKLEVFPPSGYNSNFMYYEESMDVPGQAGVGMGGQKEFFAWYIDEWLDHGHCRGEPFSSTFKNPRLSAVENFDVDRVEVWQVNDEFITMAADPLQKQSATSKNKEDQIIMSLNGRQTYADKGPA